MRFEPTPANLKSGFTFKTFLWWKEIMFLEQFQCENAFIKAFSFLSAHGVPRMAVEPIRPRSSYRAG